MRAGECELSSCPRKKSTDALSLRFGNPRTKSDRRHLRLKGQIPSIFFRLFRVTINKIDHQMQQSAPGWRRFSKWAAAWRSLGDGVSRQLCSLNGEALSAEARRRTGLEDFGDPPIDTALSTLVNSLELQADLHPLGRLLMWVHLLGLLETRLRLTPAWGSDVSHSGSKRCAGQGGSSGAEGRGLFVVVPPLGAACRFGLSDACM